MPGGKPITVVFSLIRYAMPRTMNEVPRVTMKAGTFSFAMMTPLTRPTIAAPARAATRPMTTEGKSGTPAWNADRRRQGRKHRGQAHHPADREIDAGGDDDEGLTQPKSSTGMIATRMFWELRMVRKLTDPAVVNGTATTKNRTRRPRNAQAQTRLKKRATR